MPAMKKKNDKPGDEGKMKNVIALTTPVGTIGSKVLERLLRNETLSVRAIARHPEKIPPEARARIEIVQGSMDDPDALRRLLDGVQGLFWCQPDPATVEDYSGAYEALAHIGAAAIREARTPRLIAISAAGEPGDTPAGPISALHRMESILAETGAAVRFLRCGSFFDNLLWQWDQIVERGTFTYPVSGDIPGPHVATRDIAHVAADLLMRPEWEGAEAISLIGPEDMSYDDIAELLSRFLGRPVRYESAEPGEFVGAMQSAGQSASAAQGLVDMFRFLAGKYSTPGDADRSLTPTTLADWLNR